MWERTPALLSAVALALALAAPVAWAQSPLALVRDAGEIGASLDARAYRFDGQPTRPGDVRWRGWIKVPFEGRLADGRAFSYQLTFRPSLLRSETGDEPVAAREFDYDAAARLLPGRIVSLTGAFSRARGSSDRGASRLSTFESRQAGADLVLGWTPLPARVSVLERRSRQDWMVSPLTPALAQSFRQRTWRTSAENTRLSASLERSEFEDRIGGGEDRSWTGSFAHGLRWGKGSRLESSSGFTDREGASPFHHANWDERLRLQHLATLGSEWSFARFASRTGGRSTSATTLGAGVDHRPLSGLHVGFRLSHRSSRGPGLESDVRSVTPRADVSAMPRRGIALSGSIEAAHESRSERGLRGVRLVVVDEVHTVEPTRSFLLDRAGADAASVVVRSLDRTVTFVRGVDWNTEPAGSLLQITLPAGSRIVPGQSVLVDYSHEPPAGPDVRAWSTRGSVQMSAGSTTLRVRRTARASSGRDVGLRATLPDYEEWSTELDSRWRTRAGALRWRAARSERRSDLFDARADELEVGLAPPSVLRLQTGLLGAWAHRAGAGHSVEVSSASATVSWSAAPSLQLGAGLDGYVVHSTGAPTESVLGESIQADGRLASLGLQICYRQQTRSAGEGSTWRQVSARAVRRF